MAHTKVTKNGTQNTGTANTFSYSGSFDVFKASEVEVELDNVALTFTTGTINESASPREYTVDYTAKEIHVGGANLASSNSVVIQPVTDMGAPTPRATYAPGASVTSDDLNNNQLQLMRKAMEYDEQKLSSRGGTMTGNLNLGKDIDIVFEGDNDNAHEITLTVEDPTSDKTITLPDTAGTVITTGDDKTITKSMIGLDQIDDTRLADNAIKSEHYTDGSITADKLNPNTVVVNSEEGGYSVNDTSFFTTAATDGRYYTKSQIVGGQLDNRYYTETELNPNASAGQNVLDARYFTETECENAFLRQDSSETIASGVTWSGTDNKVATTAAIDLRIIDLLDDVGGFVPISNETNFPNANPDINNGAGTIVSVKTTLSTHNPNGGTVTIANGNVGDSATVTINNVPSAIPQGYGFLVETTTTLHTYNFHRLTPKATEVSTVAANATAIAAAGNNVTDINNFYDLYQISTSAPTDRADSSSLQVGDLWFDSSSNKVMMVYDASSGDGFSPITPNQSDLTNIGIVSGQLVFQEDLGLVTDAVSTGTGNQTLNTVAGISSNVTTVAGIASNVTTVANNNSNVSAVAGKATEIGRLGTADAVADMNTLGTTAIVSDMDTLADISSNITTVAGVSSNVTTVAGISSNVTTVAGISSNVTAVANDAADIGAVAGKATEIGRLGTADAVADLAILGTTDVVADMNTLATSANVTAMDNCSDDIANINTVSGSISNVNTAAGSISNINTVAGNNSNINTVAGNNSNITTVAGANSNISTVAGSISNVNTAASNITDINTFANRYRIASSAPNTSLDEGDLYFDTSLDELRVYNGSSWQGGVTATGSLAGLTANTFSGNQTVNANIIVSGTVDGVDIATRDTLFGGLTSSSGVLSNGVTATTQSASDNSTKVATTAYVTTAVGNVTTDLVGDTSPQLGGALDGQNNNMSNIGTIDGSNLQLDFGTI